MAAFSWQAAAQVGLLERCCCGNRARRTVKHCEITFKAKDAEIVQPSALIVHPWLHQGRVTLEPHDNIRTAYDLRLLQCSHVGWFPIVGWWF
jgi:hypothetical protein